MLVNRLKKRQAKTIPIYKTICGFIMLCGFGLNKILKLALTPTSRPKSLDLDRNLSKLFEISRLRNNCFYLDWKSPGFKVLTQTP
jgi:hypothetical protein